MKEVIIWLVLLIVFIGIEAVTLGLTSIWFAGGALVALIVATLHGPVWLQIILFLITALLLLFFTRPVAMKYFNTGRVKTNVDSIVGRQAIVTGEINNLLSQGTVKVSGQEWSARSCEEGITIPKDTIVIVESVSGVKLMVREQIPKEKME